MPVREARPITRDDEVAREYQLDPASHAQPVDDRDHEQVRLLEPLEQPAQARTHRGHPLQIGMQSQSALQITTRGKRAPFTSQYDDLQVRVIFDLIEASVQLRHRAVVQGIELRRAVQRDRADCVRSLV